MTSWRPPRWPLLETEKTAQPEGRGQPTKGNCPVICIFKFWGCGRTCLRSDALSPAATMREGVCPIKMERPWNIRKNKSLLRRMHRRWENGAWNWVENAPQKKWTQHKKSQVQGFGWIEWIRHRVHWGGVAVKRKFVFSFYSVNRRNRRRKRRRPAASYKRSSDCRPRFTFVSRTLRPATCSVPPHSEWKRVELELERLSSSSSDTHNHRGKFSILWQIILIFKSNSIIIIHWSSDFVDNLITIQSNWKNDSLIFLIKSNSIKDSPFKLICTIIFEDF